jgi:hypothetical protein
MEYEDFYFAQDGAGVTVVTEDDEFVCFVDAGDTLASVQDKILKWAED